MIKVWFFLPFLDSDTEEIIYCQKYTNYLAGKLPPGLLFPKILNTLVQAAAIGLTKARASVFCPTCPNLSVVLVLQGSALVSCHIRP